MKWSPGILKYAWNDWFYHHSPSVAINAPRRFVRDTTFSINSCGTRNSYHGSGLTIIFYASHERLTVYTSKEIK